MPIVFTLGTALLILPAFSLTLFGWDYTGGTFDKAVVIIVLATTILGFVESFRWIFSTQFGMRALVSVTIAMFAWIYIVLFTSVDDATWNHIEDQKCSIVILAPICAISGGEFN